MLILCDYKKLSWRVERYLVDNFLYKGKVEVIYIKELKYKRKMFVIVIIL